VLLIVLAGVGATGFIAACAWFMAEERRLKRAFDRVLGAPPDAMLIAHGRGRAAAFSFAAGRIATAWNGGAWCLVYGLDELLGAELALDGEIAARVMRGEPRRALDRVGGMVGEARLRLLFDDPQHPDFELVLWPSEGRSAAAPSRAAEAISEANRWLARIEAVLRRTGVAVVRPQPAGLAAQPRQKPARPHPLETQDLFEDESEETEDELPI